MIANAWAIVFRTVKFSGFNLAITQASVVVPVMAQAPRFFAGTVTFGDISQTGQAFGQSTTRCRSSATPTTSSRATAPC